MYLLDQNLPASSAWTTSHGPGKPVPMVSHDFNVRKVVKFADVLVGAVLVPGARAPIVVTREMVRTMKPRSIIMDISIDQGGCVETSRPTTHFDPTFKDEGVIHYCVPNMTSVVARTATHAFNNAAWPFMREIATHGLDAALAALPALRRGVATHRGTWSIPRSRRTWACRKCRCELDGHSYHRKTVTAEQAVAHVQSGQRVFVTGNCSVPERLQDALVA